MIDQATTIPRGWKMTTLGKVVNFSQGFQISTDDQSLEKKEGYVRFVRIVDYTNDGEIPRYIKNPNRCFVNKDDLVMIRYGSQTAGKIVRGISGVIANNTFKITPSEDLDNNWLYWFLRQDSIYQYLNKDQSSSTMPAITFTQVGNIEIPIISLPEQRTIAAVLSSLDDKIELLREQNKTLEATAQAIFKEWFVNFNFPGATGKMIDSELGQIPEGWRVEKITNILDFVKGSEPGAANYSNEKVNNDYVPFYRVQDISQYGNIPNIYVEEKLLRGKIFSHDDILVSVDGTIGRVFIGGAGGHSGGIRRVVERHDFIKKSLILCFLKSPKFQSDLESFSGAETTIKHAGGAIEHIRFALQDDVCKKFGVAFDPLFQKIVSNISQVQTLSSLRDSLLPKLMKGEVRVKGVKD